MNDFSYSPGLVIPAGDVVCIFVANQSVTIDLSGFTVPAVGGPSGCYAAASEA
jgi:hypothetical protein